VEQADELGGLADVETVVKSRELITRSREENIRVSKRKSCVNSGGWFNTNVKNGDYDRYQGGNTIDATNLEFALQDCQKLGKMVTKTGLMYFPLAQVLLRFRQKLIPAIGRQDPTLWLRVQLVLAGLHLSEGQKASMEPDAFRQFLFMEHFPEFQPARAELHRQRLQQVQRINDALR
jgi:hypothetical protein